MNYDFRFSDADRFFLFCVVSTYCLHIARNITPLFAGLPIIFSVLSVYCFIFKERLYLDRQGALLMSVFLLSIILPFFYSFFHFPDESYLMASARYFYMVPFLVFLLFFDFKVDNLIFLIKIFVIFVMLGGSSLFYQTVFGEIAWFPEPSEREGLVRYSSLVGSLTSFGIAAGLALPLALIAFKSFFVRVVVICFIIISMLFTLQKAAVVNIFLFFLFCLFFSDFKNKLAVSFLSAIVFSSLLVVVYYFDFDYAVATIDNVLRLRDDSGVTDVDLISSIFDRLWELPSKLYLKYGDYGLIFGVGFVAGSGALGFIDYPMSHNGFFDLLFLGGLLNLFCFLLLSSFVFYRLILYRKLFKYIDRQLWWMLTCLIFVFFLLMLNMAFSGVVFIQPYTGIVFYSIVVFSLFSLPRLKLVFVSQYIR